MVASDFKFQSFTANLSHDGKHFCSLAYGLTRGRCGRIYQLPVGAKIKGAGYVMQFVQFSALCNQ